MLGLQVSWKTDVHHSIGDTRRIDGKIIHGWRVDSDTGVQAEPPSVQAANQVGRTVRTIFRLGPLQRPRLMRTVRLEGVNSPVDDRECKFMSTAHPNRLDFSWMQVTDMCAPKVRDRHADGCPRFGSKKDRVIRAVAIEKSSEHWKFLVATGAWDAMARRSLPINRPLEKHTDRTKSCTQITVRRRDGMAVSRSRDR